MALTKATTTNQTDGFIFIWNDIVFLQCFAKYLNEYLLTKLYPHLIEFQSICKRPPKTEQMPFFVELVCMLRDYFFWNYNSVLIWLHYQGETISPRHLWFLHLKPAPSSLLVSNSHTHYRQRGQLLLVRRSQVLEMFLSKASALSPVGHFDHSHVLLQHFQTFQPFLNWNTLHIFGRHNYRMWSMTVHEVKFDWLQRNSVQEPSEKTARHF